MPDPDTLSRLQQIGRDITPENARRTQALLAGEFAADITDGIRVTRDVAYGDDPRHRLDLFTDPAAGAGSRPVVVFVHGGNFVAGDKRLPGSVLYDNVGTWLARAGLLGVTMNYRLAPAHRHPAGSDDLGAAVRWLGTHAHRFGGDHHRIVLMGASAGATHVASYLAADDAGQAAGAVLLSGLYDLTGLAPEPVLHHYYGPEPALDDVSPLSGLARSPVPLMVVVAELDPPEQQRQFLRLAQARLEDTGSLPRLAYLAGHNHFSEIDHLGTRDESLAAPLRAFLTDLYGERS